MVRRSSWIKLWATECNKYNINVITFDSHSQLPCEVSKMDITSPSLGGSLGMLLFLNKFYRKSSQFLFSLLQCEAVGKVNESSYDC